MDRTSWIGFIFAFVVLVGGLILKGSSPTVLLNGAALVIIFAGTVASILIAFPMNELRRVPQLFRVIFKEDKGLTVHDLIPLFSEWTVLARREGLLALEEPSERLDDEFLKRGLRMVVDGESQDLIRNLLEEDIAAMEDRHTVGAKIFSQAGTYAPTLGVLGAVIGLVAALSHLEDVALLGKSISAAFIATLFGIFSGYVLWHPFANKLKQKSAKEAQIKQIMIEGILAVQEGLPARVVEEKLKTYLPSKERDLTNVQAKKGKAGQQAGDQVEA